MHTQTTTATPVRAHSNRFAAFTQAEAAVLRGVLASEAYDILGAHAGRSSVGAPPAGVKERVADADRFEVLAALEREVGARLGHGGVDADVMREAAHAIRAGIVAP